MAMNPRTHPRGARPDFSMEGLPPKPKYTTDAVWWLVCMRLRLEPGSQNSGTFANKAGSHNIGRNLPDYGEGDSRTDHSIRHKWNRTGPWWRDYSAATDWTFPGAHHGDHSRINLYTGRMLRAMRDPDDTRPDHVMFYCIGQEDSDRAIEGWHELRDEPVAGDDTHDFHRHDSLFRDIIGNFWSMWAILTIDMGWKFAEWQQSTAPIQPPQEWSDMATKEEIKQAFREVLQEVIPYTGTETSGPRARIHSAGWGDTSVVGRLDYLTEMVMAPQTAEGQAGAVMARLERIEDGVVALQPAPDPDASAH